MSPFSTQAPKILEKDEDFSEWIKVLADKLREALPKHTHGIDAIFASVNHHANTAAFDPQQAATYVEWFLRSKAKELGFVWGDSAFGPKEYAMAASSLDDQVLAVTRKMLARKFHPLFDSFATDAQKTIQASKTGTPTPANSSPVRPPRTVTRAQTAAGAAATPVQAPAEPPIEDAPTTPPAPTPLATFRSTHVLHALFCHFAPRGATGVAFLIVDVIDKLQAVMISTADNKPPAVIAQRLAQCVAACDTMGEKSMSLSNLCGIVSAAVLASSDSTLSETGHRLLSDLADHTDDLETAHIDISDVAAAVHQRRQVLDSVGNSVKSAAGGGAKPKPGPRAHGFLGGTDAKDDRHDRHKMPTSKPDHGKEWAWGAQSRKWFQRPIATSSYKQAALQATASSDDDSKINEAAAEACQMGRSTFMVDDRAFRIVEGSINELTHYSPVLSLCAHTTAHANPILDSGAQNDMMPPEFMAASKLRSAHTQIIGVGGALPASEVKSGTAEFITATTTGAPTKITLPAALSHKGIQAPLISMHKLLERGFKITLGRGTGLVTTPQGDDIQLIVRNRLWSFPGPPAIKSSFTPRHQGIPASPNPFDALASHDAPTSSSANVATRSATRDRSQESKSIIAATPPPSTATAPRPASILRRTSSARRVAKAVQWQQPVAISRAPATSEQRTRQPCPQAQPDLAPGPAQDTNTGKISAIAFHHKHLHAHGKALVKIRARLLAEDATQEAYLPSAAELRQVRCTDCSSAAMRKPPAEKTHPRRDPSRNQDMRPGEFLNIDLLGRVEAQQIGFRPNQGHEILTLTDSASSAKTYVGLPDKTAASVLFAIQEWICKSQTIPKRITCDSEIATEDLKRWGAPRGIDIVACPPHEHASNGRAESAVGFGKAKTATLRQTGGADDSFIALALEWIGIQSAFLPCKANANGASPITVWPHIPYLQHHRKLRHDIPLFCLCFRATDASQGDSNLSRKGKACVFLGWSRNSESYRLLDLDTHRVIDGRRVTFHEEIFPLKDRLRAGEALPSREPFFVDGTRALGNIEIQHASDDQLATYCALKNISAAWPSTAFPADAPHCWGFRAHRPIAPSQTTTKTHAIDVQVTSFTGTSKDMNNQVDNQYHQRPYLFAIPVSHTGSGDDTSLRSAIAFCFPSAVRLWDIAEQSAARLNKLSMPTLRVQHVTPWHPAAEQDVASPASVRVGNRGDNGQPRAPPTQPCSPPVPPVVSPPSRKELRQAAAAERRAGSRRTSPRAPPATGSHFARNTWCFSAIRSPPGDRAVPRQSMEKLTFPSMFDHEHLDQTSLGMLSETNEEGEGKVGFEPKNIKEARAHSSWPRWLAAIHRENEGLRSRGTYVRIHRKDVPNGVQLLHSMYTFKDKSVSKARLVVQGHRQRPSPPSTETYASTPSSSVIRMLTALTAANRHKTRLIDVTQAFIQSDNLPANSRLYMVPPPEAEADRDIVWHLQKPLYGLKCAPRAWANTLRKFLESEGWQPVAHEDTLFQLNKGDARLALVFHVDDILLSYNEAGTAAADAFTRALLSRFQGRDEGEVQRYLGVDFDRHDDGSISLSQEPLVIGLLDRFQLRDCNPVNTPLPPGINLTTQDSPKDGPHRDLAGKYREVVGTLQYLATWTRPDIAHATHVLARHSSNPGQAHWTAATHVMRYLKGTSHLGLRYHATPPEGFPPHAHNKLFGYCDSDWGSDIDTRRSVGAHLLFLNGAAISWRSKLQTSTAQSTAEAEFMAASRLANEALWLRRIITALGYDQGTATPVFEDNRAVLLLAANPVHREKMKHVDISLHNLRDNVANGTVNLLACPTADMTADCLTKALPKPAFIKHREVMLGNAPHTAPPPFMAAHLAILAC